MFRSTASTHKFRVLGRESLSESLLAGDTASLSSPPPPLFGPGLIIDLRCPD